MEQVIQLLDSIYPLSPDLRVELKELLIEKTFQKKEYLLTIGEICTNIYFIKEGLLRCFYMDREVETCSWFMKEGDLVISVESFYTQKESLESIQALENTEVVTLSFNDLQYLYKKYPEFNFSGRVLTEKYYVLSERRMSAMRGKSAPDRYYYLRDNYPELILRVPLKYLASYLGVSEETLSRIRAERRK